jgi:hypothetical protein
VGVIGNGSSAIQIVPAIQPLEGIKVSCFARSPTWIIPSFGDAAMQKLGMNPSETKCKFLDKSGIWGWQANMDKSRVVTKKC